METSIRNKDQSTQREFERIGKRAVVADATAVATPTPGASASGSLQPTPGTFNLTLKYNGTNVNTNTTKINFADNAGTFVTGNIIFKVEKVGSETKVQAYGKGFMPTGNVHQTIRKDTTTDGTNETWIANDRLRNRGDSNHTYAANEGAVEIKSFAGEDGTLLRVLGVAGSSIYGIYADTDNQTAIYGNATGTGYGVVAYGNLGTALLAESVSGYGIHGISANDAIYGTSTNAAGVYGVSTNGIGVRGENASADGVAMQAQGGSGASARGIAASVTTSGIAVHATGESGQGVYATVTSGQALYGTATSGYGGYITSATGTGAYIAATGGTGAGLSVSSSGGTGVSAQAGTGWAISASNSSASNASIWGSNSTAAGTCIYGNTSASAGVGVHGRASGTSTTVGVRGESMSASGVGVYGTNTANGGVAISADASGTSSIGIYCTGSLYGLQTGSDIDANSYYASGTKVVGGQGAAVADATGAGDVVAQLNTLLARLRVHGLIAT